MPPTRRAINLFATLLVAVQLAACVSTRVTGKSLNSATPPAKQLLIVVRSGKFSANNTASGLGQKNLDSLVPHLVARVPAIFSQNGIPSRAIAASASDPQLLQSLKPEPGERVLIVSPQSATYNTRTGQELFLTAQLLSDSPSFAPVWQGQIRMGTLGFGQFDAKVADEIATQMLDKLRVANMATASEGPLRSE